MQHAAMQATEHSAPSAIDLEDVNSLCGEASMADVFAAFVGDSDVDIGDPVEQVKQ